MNINPTIFFAVLGIILLIIELFATSFFFLFLGLGAILTSVLSFYGIISGWPMNIMVFALTSIGSLLLFRKQLKELFHRRGANYQEIIDEKAVVSKDIPSQGEGKVFYRGADWIAYSIQDKNFKKGDYVTIKQVEGIKLIVE